MNIYVDYQRQVMTAEICGFQIHGFDGDKTVLNTYFADLGLLPNPNQSCISRVLLLTLL